MEAFITSLNAQTEFCAEYSHAGAVWGFNFFALDLADAEVKLENIKSGLRLLGQLIERVEAGA